VHHDAGTLTTQDGLTLATRHWSPHDRPRAVVLLVHGLSEHSGRYAHVATRLMLQDLAVYAYDHRHHGRSDGQPRAFVERFEALVEDLGLVLEWVREEAAGLPVFLLGHSMGGAVGAHYVARQGPRGLAGLALSSPALRISGELAPFLQRIAGVVSRVAPHLATTGADRTSLSRDPAVMRAWDEDPLTYKGGVRARTGHLLLSACRDLLEDPSAFTLPLYVFHGTADRITDPAASEAFVARAPSEDKTLRLYEGGYHETMNDLERERVLDDLAAWLDARAPASPVAAVEAATGA